MAEEKNFIVSFLNKLVPIESEDIRVGCNSFYISYDQSSPRVDPLQITLHYHPHEEEKTLHIRYDLMSAIRPPVVLKRIRRTPFFVSVYDDGDSVLQNFDFYQWHPTIIFRLHHYRSAIKKNPLKIFLPSGGKTVTNDRLLIDHVFVKLFSDLEWEFTDNQLTFFNNTAGFQGGLIITAFSENADELDKQDSQKIIARLNQLVGLSEKNHILNSIRIQDKKSEREIDELWQREKNITPDTKPDITAYQASLHTVNHIHWISELCRVMDWQYILKEINHIAKNEAGFIAVNSDNDRVENEIIDAYQKRRFLTDELKFKLQQWWDQYSLPLYRQKVESKLKSSPDRLFIIYFLALRYRMIWHEHLLSICKEFKEWPILGLLAKIYQLFIFEENSDSELFFCSGNRWLGNCKEFNRSGIQYKLTRFGPKTYSSFIDNKHDILKIDKEVNFKYFPSKKKLLVLSTIENKNLKSKTLEIIVDDIKLLVPLIWKKADITFQGFRLRILFKKERFQLTFQKRKNSGIVEINGEKISFDRSAKVTRYITVKPAAHSYDLTLFDTYGRTYHLFRHESKINSILHGWHQDKFGVLIECINLKINSTQTTVRSNSNCIFHAQIALPLYVDQIQIFARKQKTIIAKGRVINCQKTKLLSYSPEVCDGQLIVIIDDDIYKEVQSIKCLIRETIGFQPYYILQSSLRGKLNWQPMLYITAIDNRIYFDEKSDFSDSAYLRIGIHDGKEAIISALLP